jgi:hypothetical protein
LTSEGHAVSDGIRTRLKGCKCNLQGNISWDFALAGCLLCLVGYLGHYGLWLNHPFRMDAGI